MEYLSYIESPKDGIPKLDHPFSKVQVEKDDSTRIAHSLYEDLVINDTYSNSSSDDEIYGFDTPNKDKHNYIITLMKKLECDTCEERSAEKDVIDGIEFLSFISEQELMDYAKIQQDLRTNGSDDGLEILDDGTFSDISSNHAIVPTKTKDITRIKGWRNKHFAGINVCDDSGSSLKNDDDGFGDDFEIKSVHDESSEELESVGYAASTTSKNGFEGDTSHEKSYKRIDSPVIEDTNAVDNAEGFTLKKSNKTSSSLSNCVGQKPTASNCLDFSFDNFDMKGIFTSDKLSNISNTVSSKNSIDSFLSPLKPQDRKNKNSFESKVVVYKPRVKHSFLERLAKKINAENFDNVHEKNISSFVPTGKEEKGIRWRVPKEKLLSGNIYDLEVSMGDTKHPKYGMINKLENVAFGSSQIKSEGNKLDSDDGDERNENIAAFQSTTLEHYTTNLGELHIDFTIPKLDAADNVTHEEVLLPVHDPTSKHETRQIPKIVDEIRAKTVAEKRRLLSEHNKHSKRKQKLSFKARTNKEINNSKRVKRLRGRIEKNTQEAKLKEKSQYLGKKLCLVKEIFDEQGVITYGREKPLKSIFKKNLLSLQKVNQSKNIQCSAYPLNNSKIGMILNIGVFRPLYKEASDNVNKFAFDGDGCITPAFAKFSSSAIQDSLNHKFTVKRILVPVVDETLKKVMHMSRNSGQASIGKNEETKFSDERVKMKFSPDINRFTEPQGEISKETKQFMQDNDIDEDICDVVTGILRYVELKECFQKVDYCYDPDVPIPIEREKIEHSMFGMLSNKRKKTKLQRQIERLGGTFIAVQGEEGNEENLSQTLEENKNCKKDSCQMGCVCYHRMLREHCGKESCIFSCHCPSAVRPECEVKSKIWLLPEVMRRRNVSQSKLAPVEREYHQTVIMSKDKKITIETKHKKRERKLPSKYKDEILFDYRKNSLDDDGGGGDYGNDDDDDCILVGVEDEMCTKQNHFMNKEPFDLNRKHQVNTSIPFQQINCNPTSTHNYRFQTKPCYVRIERNQIADQMAQELTFTPGVHIDLSRPKNIITKKKQRAKYRSVNVAKKKTGGSIPHGFDIENFCSRTYAITSDYVLRNYLAQIRTKDFILYPSLNRGDKKSVFTHPVKSSSPIIKEDLVERCPTDNESDNEIEEKRPNEEERGLQIKFVHSIPSHLFENQDTVDQEENSSESISNSNKILSTAPIHVTKKNTKETQETEPAKQRFVYASLPKIDNECKWWVVELDSEKFTDLVYYSEKRSLSFSLIKNAIFDSEYNNTTIKIVLTNPGSIFKDRFGAYVVGGHKHLIFFGPYEVSESHGITAIKHEDGKFIQVPFTTKFSKSENFKSLGINMTSTNENCQSSVKAVNAVWWYSTGKRGGSNNVSKSITVTEKPKKIGFVNDQDESEQVNNSTCSLQENEITLNENVGATEDDITIEHDSVKMEPLEFYEESISSTGVSENISDTPTCTVDGLVNGPLTESLLKSEKKTNDKDEFVTTINPVDTSHQQNNEKITNETDVMVGETNLVGWQTDDSLSDNQLNTDNLESETDLVINTSNSVDWKIDDSPSISQQNTENFGNVTSHGINTAENFKESKTISPLGGGRSLLKNNVAKMKTTSVNKTLAPLDKMNPVIIKRRKRKKWLTMRRKARKEAKSQEDANMISLKKRIENLKEAILSKKREAENLSEEIISKKARKDVPVIKNSSDIDIESDSSSFSDIEDLSREIPQVNSDSVLLSAKGTSRKRIIHKNSKMTTKTKETVPATLPQYLLQKKPREGPCPEKALLSLTPGIGYVPVLEFDPMDGHLVIEDPCNPQLEHFFPNKILAINWLNLYFINRFIFKPKFEMQWVIMTGSIIRMLQPLNKDIFKYKARCLTIRPCGLELERTRLADQDLADWERREVSLLRNRIGNNNRMTSQNRKPQYLSKEDQVKDMQRHNNLERMRRSELAELMGNLGNLVLSEVTQARSPSKLAILHRARYVCEAQKQIEEELRVKMVELKKERDLLNQKLKNIFADILNHEEKKRALNICRFIRCSQYKLPDKTDKYMKAMRKREDELLEGFTLKNRPSSFRSLSRSSVKSSSSSGSLGSICVDTSSPGLDTSSSVGSVKKPTEGVLVKSKLRSLTANRPDLKIYPATVGSEVISLVDESDNEDQIIEIESEEEDVIWLPAKESLQHQDDDVEILSSNFKARRPKLKFPKPKRKLPQSSPRPSVIDLSRIQDNQDTVELVRVSADPLDLDSPSTSAQQRPTPPKLQVAPEFVAVCEHDYEPLYSEDESSCSRMEPVSNLKPKPTLQQFIPIQQTSLVNRVGTTTVTRTTDSSTPSQSRLVTPFAHVQKIKLSSILPIRRFVQNDNLSVSLKGRPVLLRKSNEGIKISKLPLNKSQLPVLTPITVKAVTVSDSSLKSNSVETVLPERENTVTLYHPSEEISVTKTVQFANLNSVQLAVPSTSVSPASSVLSGPKIRKPKDDGKPIKILLPKRS